MTVRDLWFRSAAAAVITMCLYLMIVAWVGPTFSPRVIAFLQAMGLGNTGAVFGSIVVFILPPILLMAGGLNGYYARLQRIRQDDGETRCRKCRYILRGLTEPRCPECGERI